MSAAATTPASSFAARSNMLLPGLLAWVATVGVPAAERGVGWAPRALSFVVLASMVAGPIVVGSRPRLGRVLGIHVTVGASVVTWLLLGPNVGVLHLEPVRAAIGALAWILFAFGWGSVRVRGHVPEDDPRVLPGAALPARGSLPLSATAVVAIGVLGAALPLFSAWRVTRPSHALLAHAVALVAAISLVTGAARIAVDRQSYKPVTPAGARVMAATRPLAVLAVVVFFGAIWMLLR
jgi:hypothetical protein